MRWNQGRRILSMAPAEAATAVREFDGALAWLEAARDRHLDSFAAEVWMLDAAFGHVLLVGLLSRSAAGQVPAVIASPR
jgi:hypothetical protein